MKLVKAKTTKRFGGEPYITLPRGAKVESIDETPAGVLIGKGIYKMLKESGYNSIAEIPETFEYAETIDHNVTNVITRIGFDTMQDLTKEGGVNLKGQHAGVSISCESLIFVDGLEDVDAYYLSMVTNYRMAV